MHGTENIVIEIAQTRTHLLWLEQQLKQLIKVTDALFERHPKRLVDRSWGYQFLATINLTNTDGLLHNRNHIDIKNISHCR